MLRFFLLLISLFWSILGPAFERIIEFSLKVDIGTLAKKVHSCLCISINGLGRLILGCLTSVSGSNKAVKIKQALKKAKRKKRFYTVHCSSKFL